MSWSHNVTLIHTSDIIILSCPSIYFFKCDILCMYIRAIIVVYCVPYICGVYILPFIHHTKLSFQDHITQLFNMSNLVLKMTLPDSHIPHAHTALLIGVQNKIAHLGISLTLHVSGTMVLSTYLFHPIKNQPLSIPLAPTERDHIA